MTLKAGFLLSFVEVKKPSRLLGIKKQKRPRVHLGAQFFRWGVGRGEFANITRGGLRAFFPRPAEPQASLHFHDGSLEKRKMGIKMDESEQERETDAKMFQLA